MKGKKVLLFLLSAAVVLSLCACTAPAEEKTDFEQPEQAAEKADGNETGTDLFDGYQQDMDALSLNPAAWNYDSENDVYWQLGIAYCSRPAAVEYETMGIYVPGAYMKGEANGDGTYTCTRNPQGSVKGYTAETAPVVFPVNTAGYSAQAAPSSYDYNSISSYLDAGFVYVYAGMRGRNNGYDENGGLDYSGGAPWGVTDLKAAVRYYRLNQELLAGSTDRIFIFGHSGGGAQSSLMGATGDSELYYEYLTSIGAAMYDRNKELISDAVCGAMCWCPITSLDYANEAYEWNMGQYSIEGTRSEDTWTSAFSKDLAEAYASYINELGLKDEEGNVLLLEKTENGISTSGSYYEYLLSVVEESLNHFLSDTAFPYTQTAGQMKRDGGFGGAGSQNQDGQPIPAKADEAGPEQTQGTEQPPEAPGKNGILPETGGQRPEDEKAAPELRGQGPEGTKPQAAEERMPDQDGGQSQTTFETVQDYIASLNQQEEWVIYDADTNTASVKSIEAFVKYCKKATKAVGAFDDLDRSQAENLLFGNDKTDALHFDYVMASVLEENKEKYAAFSDWKETISEAYSKDLEEVDMLGNSSKLRQDMYNPMYFISDYYEGYQSSSVAPYWRIYTGIEQEDTALTVETNLALALKQYEGVEDVEFEAVWGQGHTTAERTGNSTDNFIQWVNSCVTR